MRNRAGKVTFMVFTVLIFFMICHVVYAEGTFSDGWHLVDRRLYYYENSIPKTGTCAIDDYVYSFTDDGVLRGTGKIYEIIFKEYQGSYSYNKFCYMYVSENNEVVSGWQEIKGFTYYFDPETYAAVYNGYFENIRGIDIDGVTYLFDDSGRLMKNDWYKGMYGDENGRMLTGYQEIDGKRYLFDENGKGLKGFQTIDNKIHYFYTKSNYQFPESTEWIQIHGSWYYFMPDTGEMTVGPATINGWEYEFEQDGTLVFQTYTILAFNGFLHMIQPDGTSAEEGWLEIGADKYYIRRSYSYVINYRNDYYYNFLCTTRIGFNSQYYDFYEDGRMRRSQFVNNSGSIRYVKEDGEEVIGWYDIDGETYYFCPEMSIGEVLLSNGQYSSYYYFNESGHLQRNSFVKFEDGVAYFDENGKLYYGWLTIDGETYYFNGRVVTGLNELFRDDRYSYFYFDEQGKMVSNQMISVGEYKYYFGEDGRIVDGFVTINGNTYSSLGHFVHINHSGYSLF